MFLCNAEIVEKDHYTEEDNASTLHAMNTQSSTEKDIMVFQTDFSFFSPTALKYLLIFTALKKGLL